MNGNIMGFTLPNGKRVEAHLGVWIIAMIQILGPDKLAEIAQRADTMAKTAQNVPIVGAGKKPVVELAS